MIIDPITGYPTTGPLLDWWYVHAGYMGFKDGESRTWDAPSGIEIEVQAADTSDPLILPDQPWERDGHGAVGSFYEKNGTYIMYYRANPGGLCRAESEDGFNWTKPELGAVEFEGSKANNIASTSHGRVFEDSSAPPEERFKAIGGYGGMYVRDRNQDGNLVEVKAAREATGSIGNTPDSVVTDILRQQETMVEKYPGPWGQLKSFLTGAVSPDGLNWTELEKPLLEEFVDGDNIVFYDEHLGRYVGYLRYHMAGRRCVGRSVSDDFRTFSPEQLMVLSDPLDPPDVSFYNHAYTRYPGREDLHLMLLSRFAQSVPTIDIQLAVSHDGLHWCRPDRSNHLIDNYSEGFGHGAMLYCGPGLLEMPHGRYGAVYFGNARRDANRTDFEEFPIRLASWPKDRLGGIRAKGYGRFTLRQERYRAPEDCPDCIEAPIHDKFPPLADPNEPPRQLRLNYKTDSGGWIKAELITHIGPKPHNSGSLPAIEGYSFDECDPLQGDELGGVVTWQGKDNVARLSDTLTIRIEMHRAILFSFSL